jgi:Cys-tRNA(Pro)/Cys-tRNA(Cys) deacylase
LELLRVIEGGKALSNIKTNAMRILDKAGISYNTYEYESDGAIDGVTVAEKIGKPVEDVYKTLVTQGTSKEYYVFVIPAASELDLKAAAKSVGEKAIEMIKVSDINKVTGYIRGGCCPIGMKKEYKTVLHSSCKDLNSFIISAGKIGHQIELCPRDLIGLIKCKIDSVTFLTTDAKLFKKV